MNESVPSVPDASTPAVASAHPTRRTYFDLFLVSFAALFLELACIRWFGSMVVFLTFFTNLVLMACFLGLSVGLLAATRSRDYIALVLPITFVSAVLACGVLWSHQNRGRIMVEVGGQASPQQIYFGTEFVARDPFAFVMPIEILAGVFFVLIATMFVGLGQVMGRKFNAIPNRVLAYSTDIAGSLAGIGAFALASKLGTTPHVWFLVAVAIVLYFLPRWSPLQIASQIGLLFVIAWSAYGTNPERERHWSPYYKIEYQPRQRLIETNNIGHQMMIDIERSGKAYLLPYLLNEAGGGEPFEDVLIIGAGSGNDVAAALRFGATRVDAVEIDPVLYELGRRDHPNRPYQDPRVTVHLDDGRNFLRQTNRQYDLIVYALVDSLVLHSGYSSLRLESFLFTEQAFEDVGKRLKPGGVVSTYNYFRQGWVVGRIQRIVESVFGSEPLVFSLPPQEVIKPTDSQGNHITFLLASNGPNKALDSIRQRLDDNEALLVQQDFTTGAAQAQFVPDDTLSADRIVPARVETAGIDRLPTDDWPFLYLKEPTIPALNLRGMAIVALLSMVVLFAFAPVRRVRPDGQMFFLGAGFMLLETKGVVHMALLFGSTWVVNSIVFAAILVMVLLANLYVIVFQPRRQFPYYILLVLALVANILVPLETYLGLPEWTRIVTSCTVVFLPIFFAGVIFASAFRDRARPDIAFGSNIGGIILGGISENASLVLGFNHLLLVAVAFYILSALTRPRG